MKRKPWEEWEINALHRLFAEHSTAHCAKVIGRTVGQINYKARQLGLRKSAEYMEREKPGQLTGATGIQGRFKKGHESWNKGKRYKAGGRSVETQFKKGQRPATWVPVGSERVTCDGIRQRKVSDTGYTPKDWESVHKLLWEEHNGPVPKGHMVVFKNRNREDIRLENLVLLSRAENARRNSIHRYPEEVKSAMRAVGKLKRAIKKREEASA